MQTDILKVKGIEFGTGKPKVCVPIVASTRSEILEMAGHILEKQPDCIELRADWFADSMDFDKIVGVLKELRPLTGNTVLLFTFRTRAEGGEAAISTEAYRTLCEVVCQSNCIDMLDVEAFMEEGLLADMSKMAHKNGVYVVASNHDFTATPSEKEIVDRLHFMDEEGADIPKIAVMPQSQRDVVTLLSATLRYREEGGTKPVITMSMGGNGVISRLSGEVFGSALTFATAGRTSAPGQLTVEQVRAVLDLLHQNL